MSFPKPDRSDFHASKVKTSEEPDVDIGWAEGAFSDGRPYRVECWAQDQATFLTYFFSDQGIESHDSASLKDVLVGEGVIECVTAHPSIQGVKILDASRNSMWSVTVLVGSDDETYVRDSTKLRPYS